MWCWKDERGFGTSLVPLLCTWPGPKVRTNRLWMCLSVCGAYVEEALHSFIKVIANQLIEKKNSAIHGHQPDQIWREAEGEHPD